MIKVKEIHRLNERITPDKSYWYWKLKNSYTQVILCYHFTKDSDGRNQIKKYFNDEGYFVDFDDNETIEKFIVKRSTDKLMVKDFETLDYDVLHHKYLLREIFTDEEKQKVKEEDLKLVKRFNEELIRLDEVNKQLDLLELD